MKRRNKDRTQMSFLTALSLSANNLRTKKGRTIMTAFAGSIGIIGIALILALSSGVNDYIQSIQEDTLSEYPLQITNSEIDVTSLLSSMTSLATDTDSGEDTDSDAEISVTSVMTTLFSQVNANDLASLKSYIESGESDILDYAKAIEYDYDVDPLIYTTEEDSYRQVNPDTSMSSSSSMLTSLMSTGISSFYSMPENDSLYKDQYEVMAGHWPENYDECVLVLTSDGSVSDYLLYALGLRDYSELDTMIEQYNDGETVTEIDADGEYSYDDVLGKTYKVVCNADMYEYDSEYDVWVDKSDNKSYMKDIVADGEDLKIVGVVKPSEDSISAALTSGINYPKSLITHISEQAADTKVVKEQMENPDINIFTGEEFGVDSDDLDMSSLISIDDDAIKDMFNLDDAFSDIQFDTSDMDLSNMDLDMSSIDLSDIDMDLSDMDLSDVDIDLSDLDMDSLADSITIDTSSLSTVVENLMKSYQTWLTDSGYDISGDLSSYLQSDEGKKLISSILNNAEYTTVTVDGEELVSLIEEAIKESDSSTDIPQAVADAVSGYISDHAVISISDTGLSSLTDSIVAQYTSDISTSFTEYMSSDTATQTISSALTDMIDMSGLNDQLTKMMESYMKSYSKQIQSSLESAIQAQMESITEEVMAQITDQFSDSMETMMDDMMDDLSAQISDSITDSLSLDTDTLTDAFGFDMDSDSLMDLMTSMTSSISSDYDSNLSTLGYADIDAPSEIDIYSYDFDSKDEVVAILDAYNAKMEADGQDEKVITYTDMVGTMMSSVTTIVNTVSYVLIAFIAVSLLVSCIMISIITQISVMERIKEIGVLRAMGASKGNISSVFNAETFIIGACSGVIGVGVTKLLIYPINFIIHTLTGDSSVNAILQWNYAIILVIISIVITVCSGLVPALKAAKQDPVTALRTE